MSLAEKRLTVKIPRFDELRDDDFHWWCLRMMAALRVKKVAVALINPNGDAKIVHETLLSDSSALRGNALQAAEHFTTANDAWNKLKGL